MQFVVIGTINVSVHDLLAIVCKVDRLYMSPRIRFGFTG